MTERRESYWTDPDFVETCQHFGLSREAVTAILGVDYQGNADDAITELQAYLNKHRERMNEADIAEILSPFTAPASPHQHSEAQTIAFANAFLPDGTQVNITARQGATPDAIVATVTALSEALRRLGELGIHTKPQRQTKPVSFAKQTTTSNSETAEVPGPTDFWRAVKPYIGTDKPFESKIGVSGWLTQFGTGKATNWADAIKALYSLKQPATASAEADF